MDKKCLKCKLIKDVTEFGKHKLTKSGLYPSCNECRRNYRKDNRDMLVIKDKEYYERVKYSEKYQKTSLDYYANNRDKKLEYAKDYFAKNKEKVLKRQSEWVQRKYRTDPSFNLTKKIRATIGRTLKNKECKSISYFGVKHSTELLDILTQKCDNKNWLNEKYQIDHIWQVHWFTDSLQKDPEGVSKIINHHRNLRAIPKSHNINRSKLDFSPLDKIDLIFYKPYLNKDIINQIKIHFM